MCKLAGRGEITGRTMLLGNVKAAECLIFVALHLRPTSTWLFGATVRKGEKRLEKEPDTTFEVMSK